MDDIFLTMDKCFADAVNYPKGYGDTFKGHAEECHSDHDLCHILSTKGNRQDIICMHAEPTCVKRPHYVEFLNKKLRVFILLSSVSIATMF